MSYKAPKIKLFAHLIQHPTSSIAGLSKLAIATTMYLLIELIEAFSKSFVD